MKNDTNRAKIAYSIVFYHFVLIGMLVILRIAGSLIPDELNDLLRLLLPITSLYAGTAFNYIAASIKSGAQDEEPVAHASIVKSMIRGHFFAMFILIFSKAGFNFIDFSTMLTLMTLLESTFGVYMGIILTSVFNKKNESN